MRTLTAVAVLLASLQAHAQPVPSIVAPNTSGPGIPGVEAQPGAFLLTVFLRHDQTKTVDEINEHLKQTGWYSKFPGAGVEIVSWYVMMGIGQVVTLRVPADKLREVNRVIESTAWGGYRTEFYPTYDYRALWDAAKQRAAQ